MNFNLEHKFWKIIEKYIAYTGSGRSIYLTEPPPKWKNQHEPTRHYFQEPLSKPEVTSIIPNHQKPYQEGQTFLKYLGKNNSKQKSIQLAKLYNVCKLKGS